MICYNLKKVTNTKMNTRKKVELKKNMERRAAQTVTRSGDTKKEREEKIIKLL